MLPIEDHTKKGQIVLKLMLLGLGVFAGLICLEIALRVIPLRDKAYTSDRPKNFYLPTTSHTGRGNIAPAFKSQDRLRITVVGDSFTFGPEVQFFDTFSSRLERLLNLNPGEKPVEVVNLGSPGYSTHHEVRLVEEAIKGGSDLVILEVTLNDAQPAPLGRNPLHSAHTNPHLSILLDLVESRVRAYKSRQEYIDYHYDLFRNPANKERFKSSLRRMKQRTTEAGIPFVAVIFPLFDFPIGKEYPFRELHREIQGLMREQRIPFLDLQRSFSNIDIGRLQVLPGKDSHPSEIAHRIAAEAIFEWLPRTKSLPPYLFEVRTYASRHNLRDRHKHRAHVTSDAVAG